MSCSFGLNIFYFRLDYSKTILYQVLSVVHFTIPPWCRQILLFFKYFNCFTDKHHAVKCAFALILHCSNTNCNCGCWAKLSTAQSQLPDGWVNEVVDKVFTIYATHISWVEHLKSDTSICSTEVGLSRRCICYTKTMTCDVTSQPSNVDFGL